jgi:small subunit ribosomal protein S2
MEQAGVEMTEEKEEKPIRKITIRSLLESGAHYGHKPSYWNPKMAPYIYGLKNNAYVIDLDRTKQMWESARDAVYNHISSGGTILFVGRRRKVVPIITEEATRAGAFYMAGKWPGGTLTNFNTLKKSVDKMLELENFIKRAEEGKVSVSKRELLTRSEELEKLHKKFNGIRDMKELPGMVFTTHATIDRLALKEASDMQIPVVGLADTDANPDLITHLIPTNDDATTTLQLFISNMAETVLEARREYELNVHKQREENEQTAQDFIESELE